MNKKVVFLGSKNIGLECLKILYNNQIKLNYEIVGVLSNPSNQSIKNYALDHNLIYITSLQDYLYLEDVDICISVQYHKILKKIHINKANDLTINLHMAPLPEYRGCNQFSMAILEEKNIFGTTIHKIDKGIDSGDILFESRFKIPKNCFIEDLYSLTYKKSLQLFKKSLPKIIKMKFVSIPQKKLSKVRGTSIHYRKEIDSLKKISLSWNKNKIEKYIRALSMDGFTPPYIEIKGKKIFLK